jgi:hypothetical protein
LKRKVFTADSDKVFATKPWWCAYDGSKYFRIESGKVQVSTDRETWTDKLTLTNISSTYACMRYTNSKVYVAWLVFDDPNYYLSYAYTSDSGENWTSDSAENGEDAYDNIGEGDDPRDVIYLDSKVLIVVADDTQVEFYDVSDWSENTTSSTNAGGLFAPGFLYNNFYYYAVGYQIGFLNYIWIIWYDGSDGGNSPTGIDPSYLEAGYSWIKKRGNNIYLSGLDGDSHKVVYTANLYLVEQNLTSWSELDTGQDTNRPTFALNSDCTELELLCFPSATKSIYYVTKGGYFLRIAQPTIATYTYMFGANGQLGRGTVSLASVNFTDALLKKKGRLQPRSFFATYMGVDISKGDGLYLTDDSDTLLFCGVYDSIAIEDITQSISAVEVSKKDLEFKDDYSFTAQGEDDMIKEVLKNNKFLYEGTTIDDPGGSHTITFKQISDYQILKTLERYGLRYISWDTEGALQYDADASTGISITDGDSTVPKEVLSEGHAINGVLVLGGRKTDGSLARAIVYSPQAEDTIDLYNIIIYSPELTTDALCTTLANSILSTKGNTVKLWQFSFWGKGQPIAGQTIEVTNAISGHASDALFVQSYTYDPVSDYCTVVCSDYIWFKSKVTKDDIEANREILNQVSSAAATNATILGDMEGVKDEDDMASDSATHLATQQSIKAYVDDNAGGGGISDIVEDVTPQLGGDLDLNGKSIDFPSVANISDCKDEDDMASDSATMLATQQSIKAYTDNSISTHAGDDDAHHARYTDAEVNALIAAASPKAYVMEGALPYSEANKCWVPCVYIGNSATSYVARTPAGTSFTNTGSTNFYASFQLLKTTVTTNYHLMVDAVRVDQYAADNSDDLIDRVIVYKCVHDTLTAHFTETDNIESQSSTIMEFDTDGDTPGDLIATNYDYIFVVLDCDAGTANQLKNIGVSVRIWYASN